jgi:1,4-alpha-glucan branching enzyme
MEMSRHIKYIIFRIAVCFAMMLCPALLEAQAKYTFSQGNMQIQLSKDLGEKELDAFIVKYDVADLALKLMLRNNFKDSILNKGWKIEENTNKQLVISKPLQAADNLNLSTGSINLSINTSGSTNPIPLHNQKIGINIFRKQAAFAIKDSVVAFVLKNHPNAKQVLLAGNFTAWGDGALPMTYNGESWMVRVKLSPGKYSYKFIVDGNWINDPDNAVVENDGEGNNNSIFYNTNTIFKLEGFTNAKKVFVAGSFANWEDGKLRMNKTNAGWELPAFLDTGTYTYRFLVDNKWMTDPAKKEQFPNEFGEYNSVVSIGKPVFFMLSGLPDAKEVFLAGSFNDWRSFELKMTKLNNGWGIPYTLGAGNYEYKFYADGQWLNAEGIRVREDKPGSVFVIAPNYTFRLKGRTTAKTVYLAGDFNGWSPNAFPMKKDGDDWVMPVHLSTGKHLYKFVVDGQWIIDPGNELWEENEHGTGNSIIWMK